MKWDNIEAYAHIYEGRNLTVPQGKIHPDKVRNVSTRADYGSKMNDLIGSYIGRSNINELPNKAKLK